MRVKCISCGQELNLDHWVFFDMTPFEGAYSRFRRTPASFVRDHDYSKKQSENSSSYNRI